jgi:hypothetical protein
LQKRSKKLLLGCRGLNNGVRWGYMVGMDHDTPPTPSLLDIEASLARADAEVAGGQTVPARVIHERLRHAIRQAEAEQRKASATR